MIELLNLRGGAKLPLIRQNAAAECGIAALAMVLNYHGHKIDLMTLRRQCAISIRGATLKSIIAIAAKYNLTTRPVRVPLEEVSDLHTPAILHWDMNHYVVLKHVKGNRFAVHDPAIGERIYYRSEFSKHFTGVAVELRPSEEFTPKKENTVFKLSQMWGRLSGFKRSFFHIFSLSVVMQIFVLALPFYLQIAVDDVLPAFDTDLLWVLAFGYAGFALINFMAQILRGYLLLYFGSMLSFQMIGNLSRHMMRLPIDFFEKRHVGDILSRFQSVKPIEKALTESLIAAIIDGIMAISTLIIMYVYQPFLATIALVAWGLFFMLRMATYTPLRNREEDVIVSEAKERTGFIENLRGITTIKLFRGEEERQLFWQKLYADIINENARLQKYKIWFDGAEKCIFNLEWVIVIFLAISMVTRAEITLGMLFAFMAYKRSFTEAASVLVERVIEFRLLRLHLERISDIALSEKEPESEADRIDRPDRKPLQGNIECHGICYGYSSDTPSILNTVNFSVAAGERIAIIGASGCGKTTLLKIMTGLFSPTSGQVKVDGMGLHKYGMANYRRQIGVVMQNDELFAGSISENIGFFDGRVDMQKIQETCIKVAIHDDIINMPMGYETLVGDMGSTLSGGQIQRIILARALYHDPKILFIDEGTAHLDVKTEKIVNDCLKNLGITQIVIAHRSETIQSSNRIFEMCDGKLYDQLV